MSFMLRRKCCHGQPRSDGSSSHRRLQQFLNLNVDVGTGGNSTWVLIRLRSYHDLSVHGHME